MVTTMWVALAFAGKNKPPKAPKAAAGPAAVARYVGGVIELAQYDAAVGCDAAPETEPLLRAVLMTTEDTHGWALSELQVGGATHGVWYADGERKVAGLDAVVAGQGTLSFDPVTVPLDEGGEAKFGSIPATWCGAPLGSALAHPTEEGVQLSVFPAGSLHACPDGQYGAGDVVLSVGPWVAFDGQGWGFRSVMEVADGATDDFTFGGDGPKARPVTVSVQGAWLTASFAPLAPTPTMDQPSSRTRTVTGPLTAVWCGESPLSTEVGAAQPGTEGGWMRVGARWFEVGGARWSKKDGLELSTLPLSCDGSEYMKDGIHMRLEGTPTAVDFWSVSGAWFPIPASWNRGDRPAFPMPKAEGDVLALAGAIADDGWTMELKGSVPLVRCD
jgi:hypothetical protein